MKKFRIIILACLLSGMALPAYAYKIQNDMISPSGGSVSSAAYTVPKHNMQPFAPLTQSDLNTLYVTATTYLNQNRSFKDSLTFYNCQPSASGPVCDNRLKNLLLYPDYNYETVGFTAQFQNGIEAKYLEAIRLLAVLVDRNYSDSMTYLKTAIRDLMTVYMIFGDEFLIDALDLRIPAAMSNPLADDYIDDQINHLEKAVEYYRYAYDRFTEIWLTPVCCSGNTIGKLLGADEWKLFTFLSQRMFLALQEKASRETVMGDPSTLPDDAAELYLQMAAISTTVGSQFYAYGGGQLLAELNLLKQQVRNIRNGLNPLGYDDRYVPLNDFESLYNLADAALNNGTGSCVYLETQLKTEQRDYDYVLDKVTDQSNSLNTSYGQQLAELTGCSLSLPQADFVSCVENADAGLYDCQMETDPAAFETCVKSKTAGNSVLGAKYRQIKDADLNLDLAVLRHQNIGTRIDNENERVNNTIQIWKDYTGAQKQVLSAYREKMKDAVQITKTKTKVKGKKKVSTTVKTFTVQDDALKIATWKEQELLELTQNFQIRMALDNNDSAVKDLMLQEAEALLGIDMAVQNKNAMVAAYDAAVRQKDNLLYLWQQNLEFTASYWQKKLPVSRLIQSSLNLKLSKRFHELRHMCYLATKALEYKYMEKMECLSMGAFGEINISDIFKLQTAIDFGEYLSSLNTYNVMSSLHDTFQPQDYSISFSKDILGITAADETARHNSFQEFVNSHLDAQGNLVFTFTTAVNQQVFEDYFMTNMKIWHGTIPYSTSTTRGFTASLFFRGAYGTIIPRLKVAQKGMQSFYRKNWEPATYYPVKIFAMMTANDTSPEPSTQITFIPFTGKDPRYDIDPLDKGVWTSAFTNRSVAATQWEVILYKKSASGVNVTDVPMSKLTDIYFFFDTIGYGN